jgi:hypothetical protein
VPEAFASWELTEEVEVPAQDRLGVRQTYRDDEQHDVTLMFGIAGEVGEGLDAAGQRETTGGAIATLRGKAMAWALVWRDAGTCGDRAVLANGFNQADFESLMREANILAQQ